MVVVDLRSNAVVPLVVVPSSSSSNSSKQCWAGMGVCWSENIWQWNDPSTGTLCAYKMERGP